MKIFYQNTTFLQNELLTKNEITKLLTETQTNNLKTLSSVKSNQTYESNQTNLLTCQKQHQSLPSQQQNPINHSNHNECVQSADKGCSHDIKTDKFSKCAQKQKLEEIAKRSQIQTLCIGNLSDNTTENDLYKLFGLSSTKYLNT